MISGTNLSLRALEKTDLAFLHRLDNSFRHMRFFFEEPYETFRELEDLYEQNVHNHRERWFILEKKSSRESIGVITLYEIDEINRKAEIDLLIDVGFQGKGFGKEGFVLGTKYGFDILNLHKLYLYVMRSNDIARKIYEFAGYQHECELTKEYFVNGEYVNVDRLCLFAAEWHEKRAELGRQFDLE